MPSKKLPPGWLVMTVGVLAYTMTVSQRSTMGVASLAATARFHTTAEQLSSLAVAQLIAYAAMQIPVGLLLDRFGPRKMITFGAVLISLGQIVVAFSAVLAPAVTGRVLVGVGDAFTFISLIRLINGWYTGIQASRLQQWLGNAGQFGQIVSAIPFAMVLRLTNWTSAFVLWAGLGLLFGFLTLVLVVDERSGLTNTHDIEAKDRIRVLRRNIGSAATKTAFWTHFCTMSPSTVMLLLWGVPFLVVGEGLPKQVALTLLGSMVFVGLAFGTLYGAIGAGNPRRRRNIVIIAVFIELASLALVLAWPGQAPMWALVLFLFNVAATAPSSMFAFDYSRQHISKSELGAANGFINVGGFLASFSMIWIIGLILDLFFAAVGKSKSLPLYSVEGFHFALLSIFAVVGFGLWRFTANEKRLSHGDARE